MPDYYKGIRKQKKKENDFFSIIYVHTPLEKLNFITKYHDKRPYLFEKSNKYETALYLFKVLKAKFPKLILDIDYGFYKSNRMFIMVEQSIPKKIFHELISTMNSKMSSDEKARKFIKIVMQNGYSHVLGNADIEFYNTLEKSEIVHLKEDE